MIRDGTATKNVLSGAIASKIIGGVRRGENPSLNSNVVLS